MPLYDSPAQCNIGDGVLASDVQHLGNFDTGSNVIEYRPDLSAHDVARYEGGEAFEKPFPVETWIFARRDWSIAPGKSVPAWIREN